MLQWARENGWEWNTLTCAWAARRGRLETLQWARENGCPWNSECGENVIYTKEAEAERVVHDEDDEFRVSGHTQDIVAFVCSR